MPLAQVHMSEPAWASKLRPLDIDDLPQPAPALKGQHAPEPGQKYPAPPCTTGEWGPIATAMLFEDEEIRVWENRIPSKSRGPRHFHEHDYWLATVRGARPGDLHYVRRGAVETAANPMEAEALVYLVELKQHPAQDAALPPACPSASSAVLYENSEMRVWDQRVPAGAVGRLPLDTASPHVFHFDVHGQRKGATPLSKIVQAQNPKSNHPGASANLGNPNRFGTIYHSTPTAKERGTATAVGPEPYRGVVLEIKEVHAACKL